MNDFFSLTRFGLLFRKHITEEYKQYLILAAGLLSIMLVFNALTTFSSMRGQFDSKMPEMTFLCGFIFGGSIFASLAYHFFQNTAKGIRFLQLPSSQLEKILVMYVVTQLLFFVIFLALFYFTNWLMCTLYNTFKTLPPNISPERVKFYTAELYDINLPMAKLSMILFFVLSAIFHFGSLCFYKLAFIKTALAIIIIGSFVYFLNYTGMKSMISEESMPNGLFFTESIRLGGLGGHDSFLGFVLLPGIWKTGISYFLPGILYLSFWIGSYWKLKEKQL